MREVVLPVYRPESKLVTLTNKDWSFLLCLANGVLDPKNQMPEFDDEVLGKFRDKTVRRIIHDEAIVETLGNGRVKRLPFISEDWMSEREREVSMLSLAGYSNTEMARVLGLDHRPITKYQERARNKKIQQKDKRVPDLKLDEVENSRNLEMARAISFIIKARGLDYFSIGVANTNLSINESTASLFLCTGRTIANTAVEMGTQPDRIWTYLKRTSKKLRLSGTNPLIARTFLEIMRDQEKAEAVVACLI